MKLVGLQFFLHTAYICSESRQQKHTYGTTLTFQRTLTALCLQEDTAEVTSLADKSPKHWSVQKTVSN